MHWSLKWTSASPLVPLMVYSQPKLLRDPLKKQIRSTSLFCSEYSNVPQKIKHRITISFSNSTSRYKPQGIKGRVLNRCYVPMLKAALVTTAKKLGSNLCPSMGDWISNIGMLYISEYYWALIRKFWHMLQHGWNLGCYAKCNESDMKGKILYDYLQAVSREVKFIEIESIMVVVGAEGRGNRELLCNMSCVMWIQICRMEKFQR